MNGEGESDKTIGHKLGPWLRRQREVAGKTRKHVAAAINIHPVQLARIESGESGTRRDTLDALITELSLDPKEAYVKAGFWPPDQAENEIEEPDNKAEEALRAAELIKNFLQLSPERQTQILAMIKVMQADHPELLEILKPPIEIIRAEDLTESDVEEIKRDTDTDRIPHTRQKPTD